MVETLSSGTCEIMQPQRHGRTFPFPKKTRAHETAASQCATLRSDLDTGRCNRGPRSALCTAAHQKISEYEFRMALSLQFETAWCFRWRPTPMPRTRPMCSGVSASQPCGASASDNVREPHD